MLKQVSATLIGIDPMLMHKPTMVNPRHPMTKQAKEITSQTVKTDADLDRLDEIHWIASIYTDRVGTDTVPVIPATNVLECWRVGGTPFRMGAAIERSMIPTRRFFPLQFQHVKICSGPDGWKRLYDITDADGVRLYADLRAVNPSPSRGSKGGRVMRCRPVFAEWQVVISFTYEDFALDEADIRRALEYAGERQGLGDYRPQFGKFMVDDWKVS